MSAGECVRDQSGPARAIGSEVATRLVVRCQGGFSLVEVLVVAFVAVPVILTGAYGLFTAISASSSTETRQRLEAAMTSYAESLKSLPTYAPCATASDVNTAFGAWPDRWNPDAESGVASAGLAVADVDYWDQSTAQFTDSCSTDMGARRLTMVVTDQSGNTLRGTVVTRNPGAHP